jgi:hypothetical protein
MYFVCSQFEKLIRACVVWVLWFSPPITKTGHPDITEILLQCPCSCCHSFLMIVCCLVEWKQICAGFLSFQICLYIIIKFYLKSILIKHYNTSSNELFKLTTYKIHTTQQDNTLSSKMNDNMNMDIATIFQLYRDDQFLLLVEKIRVPRENHRCMWIGHSIPLFIP